MNFSINFVGFVQLRYVNFILDSSFIKVPNSKGFSNIFPKTLNPIMNSKHGFSHEKVYIEFLWDDQCLFVVLR